MPKELDATLVTGAQAPLEEQDIDRLNLVWKLSSNAPQTAVPITIGKDAKAADVQNEYGTTSD